MCAHLHLYFVTDCSKWWHGGHPRGEINVTEGTSALSIPSITAHNLVKSASRLTATLIFNVPFSAIPLFISYNLSCFPFHTPFCGLSLRLFTTNTRTQFLPHKSSQACKSSTDLNKYEWAHIWLYTVYTNDVSSPVKQIFMNAFWCWMCMVTAWTYYSMLNILQNKNFTIFYDDSSCPFRLSGSFGTGQRCT